MPSEMLQTIPVLRIFDLARAREFYLGFLGFTVDWEHRFDEDAPVYLQVSRSGAVLHLSEHHGDGCPGATVYVRMTGLDDYHRELTAKRYTYMRPGIERRSDEALLMEVVDPFGNRIRFAEELEPAAIA